MATETYNYTSIATTTAELNAINLEPNLWVYSKTVSVGKSKSSGTFKAPITKVPTVVEQGFLNDKNYSLLKSGKAYRKLPFCLMSHKVREQLRKFGWSNYFYNNENFEIGNEYDVISKIKKFNTDSIVSLDSGSHMIFDRNGQPLPVGVPFDYISHGGITDGRYDLDKLAKHLLSRSDILIYNPQGWRRDDLDYKKSAKTVADAIVDIPYYNSEPGCTKTIYFIWQPTQADYLRMWTLSQKLNRKYPSTAHHQAIFDLDLLGVRAAGIAYFDNYHESRRYAVDYDD